MNHLDALNLGLSNERQRLRDARTEGERQLRLVWIAQTEREIAAEEALIGHKGPAEDISDEDLLSALGLE